MLLKHPYLIQARCDPQRGSFNKKKLANYLVQKYHVSYLK